MLGLLVQVNRDVRWSPRCETARWGSTKNPRASTVRDLRLRSADSSILPSPKMMQHEQCRKYPWSRRNPFPLGCLHPAVITPLTAKVGGFRADRRPLTQVSHPDVPLDVSHSKICNDHLSLEAAIALRLVRERIQILQSSGDQQLSAGVAPEYSSRLSLTSNTMGLASLRRSANRRCALARSRLAIRASHAIAPEPANRRTTPAANQLLERCPIPAAPSLQHQRWVTITSGVLTG